MSRGGVGKMHPVCVHQISVSNNCQVKVRMEDDFHVSMFITHNCPWDKLSWWQNVLVANCPWANHPGGDEREGEMSREQTAKVAKRPVIQELSCTALATQIFSMIDRHILHLCLVSILLLTAVSLC